MSEVFLLGAGFSRAISPCMPLLRELGEGVLRSYKSAANIPKAIEELIQTDLESALTFLLQDKPWLSEADNLRQKALYFDLAQCIRGVLSRVCRGTEPWPTNTPQLWLEALITYWHRKNSTVLTLNYDTLVEQVASSTYWQSRSESIATHRLYPIPLLPAGSRVESNNEDYGELDEDCATFKLLKLHGSINWFYSGRADFYGEQLYYVPCKNGLDGPYDALMGFDPVEEHWRQTADKTPLIIPPVLDKGVFFQHETLRSMWFKASRAIAQAKKLICIGYSLPKSDLTMAHFLRTSTPQSGIDLEIVNVSDIVEHYRSVLGSQGFRIKQTVPSSKNCVQKFVLQNCELTEDERIAVVRDSGADTFK